jgi:enterochelin esterase-like enzyme
VKLASIALLAWLMASSDGGMSARPGNPLDSPRLTRLTHALAADERGVVEAFWREVSGHCPLVEPMAGDDSHRWVTFLWRGRAATRAVDMLGEVPTMDMSRWGLRPVPGTDIWFKTERVPREARFGYKIRENGGEFRTDPLNPRTLLGRSVVELPDAPPEPWLRESAETPKGKLVADTIESKLLNERRTVGVYLPPGRVAPGRAALLVVFDGESYGNGPETAVPTPLILDNLIAAERIPPVVAVLVNSQETRSRDLQCSPAFADFIAQEIVPWARQRYRVTRDARRTVVAGSSLGGLAAACTALRHPNVLGRVLSQSGTFTYFPAADWDRRKELSLPTGWLARRFVTSPKLPLGFYVEVGIFEGGPVYNLLRENRHLRDVLEARGYSVAYREFAGGHDYFAWRSSLGDGLIALLGSSKPAEPR